MLTEQVFALEGFAFAVNYGLNKVRFPAPLPVGKRVRMHAKLTELAEVPGGAQMTVQVTFEREGGDKPVCVAETLARVYDWRGSSRRAGSRHAPGPGSPLWRTR